MAIEQSESADLPSRGPNRPGLLQRTPNGTSAPGQVKDLPLHALSRKDPDQCHRLATLTN